MTNEEKQTHNKCHLKEEKKTATEKLIQKQQANPEVQKWKKQENAEQVIEHQGLLFQRWYSRDRAEEVFDQVVLPHSYCLDVLTLAQYVPMAAHLRRKRTAKWILKWF